MIAGLDVAEVALRVHVAGDKAGHPLREAQAPQPRSAHALVVHNAAVCHAAAGGVLEPQHVAAIVQQRRRHGILAEARGLCEVGRL